jgi:L-iditol 2-dehydrogenase
MSNDIATKNKGMKVGAAVMVAPGKLEYQELPYPDHLEPGAMIVKMEMSGICGTDKHAFKGETTLYGGTEAEQDMVFPTVHGHENSGIVVEMNGDNIEYSGKPLKVGDRVTNCPNVICGECCTAAACTAIRMLEPPGHRHDYYADASLHCRGWGIYYLRPRLVYKVPNTSGGIFLHVRVVVVTALLDRARNTRLRRQGLPFRRQVVVQAPADRHADGRQGPHVGAGKIIAWMALTRNWNCERVQRRVTINIKDMPDKDLVEAIRAETEDAAQMWWSKPLAARGGAGRTGNAARGGTYWNRNFADTGEVSLNVHRHIAARTCDLWQHQHPHDVTMPLST